MPDETNPAPVVLPGAEDKVLSPSPTPGAALPTRRVEDTASYSGEWTLLIMALLTWAVTFFGELAQVKTWAEMQTPGFVGTHAAQVIGVILSVVAAKRIK